MGQFHRGKLLQFSGSFGSGCGFLSIQDSRTGNIESIPCDNGATVRALDSCFGNVITAGHTAKGKGYKGKEVYWSYDEFGLTLGGFTPVGYKPNWNKFWKESEDGTFDL